MKIILEVDGCKNCPYNVITIDKRFCRKCSITGTTFGMELLDAMIKGATLIDCPGVINETAVIFVNQMLDRYAEKHVR